MSNHNDGCTQRLSRGAQSLYVFFWVAGLIASCLAGCWWLLFWTDRFYFGPNPEYGQAPNQPEYLSGTQPASHFGNPLIVGLVAFGMVMVIGVVISLLIMMRGKITKALIIGGILLLCLPLGWGGWFLVARVIPDHTDWNTLSPDQRIGYLQSYADLSQYHMAPPDTSPYVRLRVLPVSDREDDTGYPYEIDPIYTALPAALVSQSPSDVGTILLLNYIYQTGDYPPFPGCTSPPARTDITLTLIDYNKGLILLEKTFMGDAPFQVFSGECSYLNIGSPIGRVFQFVTSLPQK